MSNIPVVSGGIFNFTIGGYTPPSFSGSVYDFVTKSINSIWTLDFLYAATNESLDIYDLLDEKPYAYITYSGGFTSVWSNNDYVFVGTVNSGIKYIEATCISGSTASPYDITTCLNDFSDLTPYYELTSSNIKYLHGNNDILLVITDSGVDVVSINPQSYRSYTLTSGAQKGFITSSGKFYYTVSGSNESKLCCVYTSLFDWSEPDKEYITGSGVLASGIGINDLFITEGTATNGYNTIFLATTSGVYVIDEYTDCYDIYCTRS